MLSVNVINFLDQYIFEYEKLNILKKVASYPERYTGIFRPSKPRTKLIQNLLQSREIRFGDALEFILREIIAGIGFSNLDRSPFVDKNNKLKLDQYFTDGNQYYFIEQKIRDDHDSSKKEGQITNFEKKIDSLYKKHGKNLVGFFYFFDPVLTKNRKYYSKELNRLKGIYQIDLLLFYGSEFFEYIDHSEIWIELIESITDWKANIPDFPIIDFDLSPSESFEMIKTLKPLYWKKIIANENVWKDGIIQVLFSNGTTLIMLYGYFSRQQTPVYQDLAKFLLDKINIFYHHSQ